MLLILKWRMTMNYFKECIEDLNIPGNWKNSSYGNDTCPSYEYNGYQIFIEHKDPKNRELEGKRFRIIIAEEYGYVDGWFYDTDDLNEVFKEIEKPTLTRPYSKTLAKDKETYQDNDIPELGVDWEYDNDGGHIPLTDKARNYQPTNPTKSKK